MDIEQIKNEVPFYEDFQTEDLKVLLGLIIQKLNNIEERLDDIEEKL
jgi:hypothetical protein